MRFVLYVDFVNLEMLQNGARGEIYMRLSRDGFVKTAKKTFTPDDGFLWKHYNPLIIVGALALYIMGLSENNIIHYFWQLWAVKFSTSTLFRWRTEYSTKVKRFVDRFKPEIKGTVHTDEVVVKIRKKKGWRWGCIDRVTRFKISGRLTKWRSYEEGAKPLFRRLKYHTKGHIPKIISDKLGHYKLAFNKYFYHTKTKLIHGVPIACNKHGLKYNNNPAERDNGRVKQRYKVMKGFKSYSSAEAFLDILDIHHNYIKPSMALDGSYPAEHANIHLPLGRNRLLSLILLASL
ncbi:MAG: DDE-type integrase/transposase/recombinase [Candidatus Thermoplasmatota archaeon]|nr:DDE-type integrase/transposase/recombinase [Candidatus Thermoplasmatota archaeon]